jgi:hypothetical protein
MKIMQNRIRRRVSFIFLISFLGALFWVTAVSAAEEEKKHNPWERYSLSLGGFVTNLNTSVTLGSADMGTGITTDLEEALGLDTSLTVFRADATARLGDSRRHRLDFGYWDLRRHSSKRLGADVEYGGQTYPIGTTVDSYFNLSVFKGGYSYSIMQDERLDFGVGVGLFVMPIDVGISAAGVGSTEEKVTAPLPTFNVRFDVALTPKLFLRQGLEVFYLEVGNFRGGLLSGLLTLEYKPWEHFGFGGGYNFFILGIKADGSSYPNINLTGKIDFNYSGLLLYGKFFF